MAEQDHAMRLRWATGAGGGDDADFHLGIRGTRRRDRRGALLG